MIESIDHFVIAVADLEATLTFYEKVLEFVRLISPGGSVCAAFELFLTPARPFHLGR